MTRKEFSDLVAAENNASKSAASQWVAAIFHTLNNAILDNDEVSIYGFGKFVKKKRAAKVGRMPDGSQIHIPARMKLKFIPSTYLDEAIMDEIDSVEFEDRMEKFRALSRGEEVPGYKKSGDRLVKVDSEEKEKE